MGTGGLSYADGTWEKECFGSPVSINDKVFILDISEVTNEAYGYSSDSGWTKKADGKWYYHNVRNRYKYGKSAQWALRSASVLSGHSTSAAYVDFDGCVLDILGYHRGQFPVGKRHDQERRYQDT